MHGKKRRAAAFSCCPAELSAFCFVSIYDIMKIFQHFAESFLVPEGFSAQMAKLPPLLAEVLRSLSKSQKAPAVQDFAAVIDKSACGGYFISKYY